MNFLDLDLDDAFQECFTSSGGPVIECNCGREHVCITSNYFDEDDPEDVAMIAAYEKRAKTDEKLILHYEYDTISQVEVGGHAFAEDCECEGWRRYMEFIITNRRGIKQFLILMSARATIALEHEKTFNILNDKALKVLDQH